MLRSSKATAIPKPALKQTKAYAYHAHEFAEVLTVLGATEDGFSEDSAARRLEKYGRNAFTEERQKTLIERLIDQVRSPLAMVLIVACAVTIALEEYIDAGVIALALTIAVAVGLVQEGKASRAFKRLSDSQTHDATVIRAGHKHVIPAAELVVGDIVVLQSGMQVPADLRLLKAKQLSINESTLTGEWQSVDKQVEPVPVGAALADQTSMAWMGTYVAEGYGLGVVTATGDQTAVGQLASNLRDVEEVTTPLQNEMAKVSRTMLIIIIILVSGIFGLGVWQGVPLQEMLLMSIAVAVASIPEGLPAAVTIILAVGMEALLKRGGLVRNLLAAETLGSTTYVLTDKTGTLTEGKMAVAGVIDGQGTQVVPDTFSETGNIEELFAVALCAADAFSDTKDGKTVLRGDPVEQAILKTAQTLGIGEDDSKYRSNRIDYLAFTSEQRFAAGLAKQTDDTYVLCVNGAPNVLLEQATQALSADGSGPVTLENAKAISDLISQQTRQGKRLVAVGYKQVSYNDIPEHDENILSDLVFAGVIIYDDPVRSGVTDAITGVTSAGAEVILITGDNPQTAHYIAEQVGIAGPDDGVLTGSELESMSDEDILLALRHVRVFARVLPKQKMRIAMLLQQRGEIVAMTGDGINDAPALRRANIGIAIGSGTEVAKEASDLILMKDSFATIYSAIEEGRRVVSNLKKIVGYLLSTSFSEVVLIGAALMTGSAVPILPAQILWANIIEEGLMGVAFAFEKGEPGAMKRKPQDIHAEGILSGAMLWFLAFAVTILSMLTLTLYFYARSLDLPLETLRSVMFLSVAMDSLFIAFAFRSLQTPIWRIPLKNNWFFFGSFILSVLLLVGALQIPFMRTVLSYEVLPLDLIATVVGFSAAALVVIEIAKWVYFERRS